MVCLLGLSPPHPNNLETRARCVEALMIMSYVSPLRLLTHFFCSWPKTTKNLRKSTRQTEVGSRFPRGTPRFGTLSWVIHGGSTAWYSWSPCNLRFSLQSPNPGGALSPWTSTSLTPAHTLPAMKDAKVHKKNFKFSKWDSDTTGVGTSHFCFEKIR